MNNKEYVLANQDALLEAMLNKDESTLRSLIHPDASVFGSAIHEFEKGIDNVIGYYTEAFALLPDDKKVHIRSRHFTDLNDHALVEQEFEIHFTLEEAEITLLTLRQSALWIRNPQPTGDDGSRWLLLHDHTSMPDHLGAFETISSNELLEGNLNLELETDTLKKKLNKAIADLRIAHEQLVQKEKLASIGQLTAGIAHEIKNPLNFVNNFSEIILELIAEARDELNSEKDAIPASKKESILDILKDIEANLQKIHEHGKRADSIVKSMLLHSRGKSGNPVPTNLNALLDEYTKLAYHAMRAADSSFNVDIETDFDSRIPLIEVIPQDISRAFLNIINNAMYAANDFAKSKADRRPHLLISTSLHEQVAEIRIKDNGAGIPKEIRDKIFQPFFTTKPTGAGTGLGLSMTYDIVNMHNGTLKIDSEPNQFSEFTITLPLIKKDKHS
jgi:signal transduction histidine kinase